MVKKSETQTVADPVALAARLEEIRETKLGTLSDDEVLRLLASRKQLEEEERAYREAKEAEEQQAALRKEYDSVADDIARLNETITPDKSDDDLLELIKERKDLEVKLEALSEQLGIKGDDEPLPQPEPEIPIEEEQDEEEEPAETLRPESVAPERKENEAIESPEEEKEEPAVTMPEPVSESSVEEERFGNEAIVTDPLKESGEFDRYLEQIESSPHTLGVILQGLPVAAKRSKSFMVKVAAIDPAYAMHYADSDTLKKDEDFNVRIAGIKNVRNTGNALSEMLPEMRTSKVVLAGVRQDFRNIRFAHAGMDDYDEMLSIAKRGALAKVKELKEGVDVTFLIPKILQKDKAFMEEVTKVSAVKKKEETPKKEAEADKVQAASENVSSSAPKKGPWSIRHSRP